MTSKKISTLFLDLTAFYFLSFKAFNISIMSFLIFISVSRTVIFFSSAFNSLIFALFCFKLSFMAIILLFDLFDEFKLELYNFDVVIL